MRSADDLGTPKPPAAASAQSGRGERLESFYDFAGRWIGGRDCHDRILLDSGSGEAKPQLSRLTKPLGGGQLSCGRTTILLDWWAASRLYLPIARSSLSDRNSSVNMPDQENVLSCQFGGCNAFSVEWHSRLRHVCLLVLALSLPSFSQTTTGRILGNVSDPSGAAVAGAAVVVTDVQRGTTRTVTTDDSGNYVCPALQPGVYKVRAEAKGFKTVERVNIVMEVAQRRARRHRAPSRPGFRDGGRHRRSSAGQHHLVHFRRHAEQRRDQRSAAERPQL